MRYFSMFTGIGGFELGIKQAYELHNTEISRLENKQNIENIQKIQPDNQGKHGRQFPTCVGFSEIDKYASQLLSIKWPTIRNYGDATKIDERQLPDFDLLVGGFPCQSFSIAGKRKGFDDTRGTLFFDIARILAYKKPSYLLLENVKGLLSHDGGKTFQTIIRVLTDLGYFVEWQVLNSKNFGVPQNRERVFIVGHLGGQPKRKVFPVGEVYQNDIDQLNHPTHSNDRVYGITGISPTINTAQGGRRQPKIAPTLRANHHNTADIHFIDLSTKDEKLTDEARALQARYWKGYSHRTAETSGVLDGIKIRRLTPLECERLQGFPDNWTKGFSDTQRYKMCGNAVTVNVVQYVISKMFL